MADYKWYVLKVSPKTEDKIKEAIEKKQKKGGIAYINRVHIPFKRNYNNLTQKIKKNYFSYIVLEIDMTYPHVKEDLQNIDGILGFVSSRGYSWDTDPIELTQREVDTMLGQELAQKTSVDDIGNIFQKEDKVEITHPLFSGRRGVINSVDIHNKKVEVNIQMFQKATMIKFDYNYIKKI